MKKTSFIFAFVIFVLVGCGEVSVLLGGFSFTAPSSWEISNQTTNGMDVVYNSGGETYPFSIEYATANKNSAQDLLLADMGNIQLYELGICNGFLCYGVVSGNSAGILTFTKGENDSNLTEYSVIESAQNFVKSIRFQPT